VSGIVYLVGAGPGDPRLITVRGAEVLGSADVVVYDRLAAPELLELAPPRAERVYVGKEPGRTAMPQREIEALLVERALAGLAVVRLKGGDPFVFGRGGEEVLACARASVACEVVPGVSAAIAAPAAAGIPVTHRGVARSFAVLTGSRAHGDGVDLSALAASADTLVVLMSAGRLQEACAQLVRGGRSPDEPAALVQWAWTPEQRQVVGTLGDLAGRAHDAALGPPATLVVGRVAEMGAQGASSRGISRSDETDGPSQSSGSGRSISASSSGSRIRTGRIPTAAAPVSSRYAPSPTYRHADGSTPRRSPASR